jgi:uncharacterized protein (TIGR03437 family)
VAAATAIETQVGAPQLQLPIPVFQCTSSGCVAVPISLGIDTPIYLSVYGTGIRHFSRLNVVVTINGVSIPATFAGPTTNFTGLDQVNVLLPLNLRGSGQATVVIEVDGQTSNAVMIDIQ